MSGLKIIFFDSQPREKLRPNLKSVMNLVAHATYAAIDVNLEFIEIKMIIVLPKKYLT